MLKQRARDRMFKRAVGLLVVVTALAGLYVLHLFQKTHSPFGEKLAVHGFLPRADGLKVDTPVTLAGFNIGRVTGVKIGADHRVRVDIEIDGKYAARVRTDSVATLNRPLLGSAFIDVTIGAEAQPVMESGNVIPMSRAPDLSDVVATIPPKLEKVDAVLANLQALSEDLRTLSRSLVDKDAPVSRTLVNVEKISRDAQQAAAKVNAAADQIKPTLGEARVAAEKVNRILDDVAKGTARVDDMTQSVSAILEDVRAVTGEIRSAAPDVPGAIEAGRNALNEADDVLRAAKNSFLLRGNLPPVSEDPPVMAPRLP